MATDADTLLPKILRWAPGAPEPSALTCLIDAARDFCDRTRMWRETDEIEITTPDGQALTTIEDAEICEIEWAEFEGYELTPQSPDYLDDHFPGWAHGAIETGGPKYFTQLLPDTIIIVPPAEGTLRARFVLRPKDGASTLPDFLARRFPTQLGEGAAARLLMLPGATTADPDRAVYLEAKFQKFIDINTVKAAKGQQKTRQRTRGNYL